MKCSFTNKKKMNCGNTFLRSLFYMSFRYLGSIIHQEVDIDEDIINRIQNE